MQMDYAGDAAFQLSLGSCRLLTRCTKVCRYVAHISGLMERRVSGLFHALHVVA